MLDGKRAMDTGERHLRCARDIYLHRKKNAFMKAFFFIFFQQFATNMERGGGRRRGIENRR